MNEAVEEHHVVHVLLKELKKLKPSDEKFEAKFNVLGELVKHHIEEEGEILPQAERRHIMTTRQIGFIVIGFLILTSGSLLASEQPGPSGSVGRPGGGSGGPSGKGGIPEGQTPVEPMRQGTEMNNPPEPNPGKGTQNPKQQTGRKGQPHASEEAKEKK